MGVSSTPRQPGYGYGTLAASVAASGGDLSADAATFTFTVPQAKVVIQNDSSSGVNLRILWNVTTDASATAWDHELQPGDYVASPDGILVRRLSIFCAGAATYLTDFQVKGWV